MNNLDRAIIKYLVSDITDLEGQDKQDKLDTVIAAYDCPAAEYGCYWDESGRWHYLSLRTLVNWDITGSQIRAGIPQSQHNNSIPANWHNLRFLSNALRHNELERPFIKVSSNLNTSAIGIRTQFSGSVKIEIVCDSAQDEALCDCITWRIYWLLKQIKSKLHDSINGIANCCFKEPIITSNYDSNTITFDVYNVIFVGV